MDNLHNNLFVKQQFINIFHNFKKKIIIRILVLNLKLWEYFNLNDMLKQLLDNEPSHLLEYLILNKKKKNTNLI